MKLPSKKQPVSVVTNADRVALEKEFGVMILSSPGAAVVNESFDLHDENGRPFDPMTITARTLEELRRKVSEAVRAVQAKS